MSIKRWPYRLLNTLLVLVLAFLLGSAGLVAALRWQNPPASSFMLRHQFKGWNEGWSQPYVHHRWVAWPEISRFVPLAVIAAEDQRFAEHWGFDWVEIENALADYEQGKRLRGASTLSQQTAKNLFLWPGRDWARKGLEVWFTLLIEAFWPKQRILEIYLNFAQFGPNVYGVGAAAERYFQRPASQLSLRQASLMAAVLPSPSRYRLNKPTKNLEKRAAWIRQQARQLGGLDYIRAL